MKRLIILPFVIFALSSNAQLLRFGVKAGANFPNLVINKSTDLSNINTDNGAGFHVGGMMRINVPIVYVQPEVLYTNVSADNSFTENGTAVNGTYNMQRIDIPVMAGLKMGPAAFFAGPIASFNLSAPDDIFKDGYNSATLGYQLGVGLKLLRFLVEVKYEGCFGDNTTSALVSSSTYPITSHMNMWIISAGYFFGKK